MSNKNFGVPEGFDNTLVKQEFKSPKPIFWGPKQKTKYPDSYEEPTNWVVPDLMSIPPVVRFITGGAFTNAFVNRSIYLGYLQHDSAGPHNWDAGSFVQRADIIALYTANQSTITVAGYSAPYTGWFNGTQPWYFFLLNNITGDISTQTNTLYWFRSDIDVDATGLIPSLGHIFFDNFETLTGTGLLLQP